MDSNPQYQCLRQFSTRFLRHVTFIFPCHLICLYFNVMYNAPKKLSNQNHIYVYTWSDRQINMTRNVCFFFFYFSSTFFSKYYINVKKYLFYYFYFLFISLCFLKYQVRKTCFFYFFYLFSQHFTVLIIYFFCFFAKLLIFILILIIHYSLTL